jgi:hypothetical protein
MSKHTPATDADVELLRRAGELLSRVADSHASHASLAGVPGPYYWTAAVSPGVGRAMAALFHQAAWLGGLDVQMLNRVPCDEVIALARQILGQAEVGEHG